LAIPTVDLSVAEVRDPLDQAGDLLGRGPAFWDCGVHLVGSHFPTDAKGLAELLLPTSGRSTISDQDAGAPQMKLTLKARINRSDEKTIRQALDQLAAKGSVKGKRKNSFPLIKPLT
jgi:hypothetical protein